MVKKLELYFLDIKKAFDKVWHKGLIHKLSLCGIQGDLLDWFENYLHGRLQRVIINGQSSEWAEFNAGVPQGSVLGPLLFLVYINDITTSIKHCNTRLFADDTCLFIEVNNRETTVEMIHSDLDNIDKWAKKWLVQFAPEKTKSLTISKKRDAHLNPRIIFNGHTIEEVHSHTYLGLLFTSSLSWNPHIANIEMKARKKLNMLSPLKFKLDRKSLEVLFSSFVSTTMYYGIEVWGGSYDSYLIKLEHIVIDGMRLVTGATKRSNIAKLYHETGWQSVKDRRDQAMVIMMFKIENNIVPNYLCEILPNSRVVSYNLRNKQNLRGPYHNTEVFKRSFLPTAIRLWNELDINKRSLGSLGNFKMSVKKMKENNIMYYYGKRWPSIHHARLRIGCSKLKSDLSFNLHIPDIDPECTCGAGYEDAEHFFMNCLHYRDIREVLKMKIERHCPFSLNVLLYGAPYLPITTNCSLFDAIHEYIVKSHRFDS